MKTGKVHFANTHFTRIFGWENEQQKENQLSMVKNKTASFYQCHSNFELISIGPYLEVMEK